MLARHIHNVMSKIRHPAVQTKKQQQQSPAVQTKNTRIRSIHSPQEMLQMSLI
uniref:Uncharacterized protein n=1 Tax=Arundo donax TaxID=35708 RepID=A0A0A9SVI7_ARUDO